jgi:hypothetical protein
MPETSSGIDADKGPVGEADKEKGIEQKRAARAKRRLERDKGGTSGSAGSEEETEGPKKPEAHAREEPKKRGPGRPKGSTNSNTKTRKKKASISLEDLGTKEGANALVAIHQMAAAYTGLPMLEITEQEAAILGKGVADVASQYDFGLSPKQQAWGALAMACVMVYGPRTPLVIGAVKQRSKQRRAKTAETPVDESTENEPGVPYPTGAPIVGDNQ